MSYGNSSVLAVIPARGGSKGIPGKNGKMVGGMSLIARAAAIAKGIGWIDARILSSDDPDLIEEGGRAGLDVPFVRPRNLAEDSSSSIDMWRHAWLAAEQYYQKPFDVSILLEPTSPMRQIDDIERTMNALFSSDYLAAVTVSPTPAQFTPQKTLVRDASGHLNFFQADGARYSLRQSIPEYFHRNGLCYALRRQAIVDKGIIIGDHCVPVVVERPVVNIDEPFDLDIAEWLLARQAAIEGSCSTGKK